MNYREWMILNYPELKEYSSVETFSFIKQAKTETRFLRFSVNIIVVIIISIIVIFFDKYLAINFLVLESDLWHTFFPLGLIFVSANSISDLIENKILKIKLSKIIESD